MAQESESSKENFLNPLGSFHGKATPENIVFNANLQEFANQVLLICGLETNGKIPPEEAYRRIKKLWQELKISKKNLLDK